MWTNITFISKALYERVKQTERANINYFHVTLREAAVILSRIFRIIIETKNKSRKCLKLVRKNQIKRNRKQKLISEKHLRNVVTRNTVGQIWNWKQNKM